MDADVAAYIEAIDPSSARSSTGSTPSSWPSIPTPRSRSSYGMPAYRVGQRRLNLGVWKHGVSVYGWRGDRDGGFVGRHPELSSGKGTIRIRPQMRRGSPTTSCGRCSAARSSPTGVESREDRASPAR